MTEMRELFVSDLKELDAYTPDYFREKWDHAGIIVRLTRQHAALLGLTDEVERLLEMPEYQKLRPLSLALERVRGVAAEAR